MLLDSTDDEEEVAKYQGGGAMGLQSVSLIHT
jgi:hypothetical protein